MTTELFGAPLLASAMVAYAWLIEAPRDAETIAAGNEVHHTPAWVRRFLAWALASIVVFGFVMPHTWVSVAACALVGYGAFTPVFRWRLNGLRGLDWRYVAYGNAYDRLFIGIVAQFRGASIPAAGLLAYVLETAALSAGIWLYYHQF